MIGKLVGVDVDTRQLTVVLNYPFCFDDEVITWAKKNLGKDIDLDYIEEWQDAEPEWEKEAGGK